MTPDEMTIALTALTERVAGLEAERAALSLMHRYAAALDDPDPAALSRLFTPDGTLATPRAEHRGRAAIVDFFTQARQRDASTKRHFVCQPEVTTTGPDRAALQCYFLYTALPGASEPPSVLGWGAYRAECRIDSGTALFESLRIAVHATSELAAAHAL
ncbi:nuclear transport factor 2 family protein [Rhodococcus sp. NPDC004095]